MSDAQRALPLAPIHRGLGARMTAAGNTEVPRNYGDPAGEYRAAREGAVIVDRSERGLIRVHGREPVKMIQGLVSNDLAGSPAGRGVYAVVLTPRGRLVADVRLLRRGDEVWIDAPAGAVSGLEDHLSRYVPPLFARHDDLSEAWGMLGIYGPRSRAIVERFAGDLPPEMPEDGFEVRGVGGVDVVVLRTLETGGDGYDVLAPAAGLEEVWRAAVDGGARPAGRAALEVLRIEAGRPRWGAELTNDVIPLEAGLRERAISETKGCYTGQEVIVRILHRGHVNRLLRGFLFGDRAVPAAGTELRRRGEEKVVGTVTSACASPRLGQTIGLGYVRREVEPPAELADPRGEPVGVVALPFDPPT